MPSFDSAELAKWSGGAWQPGPPAGIGGVSNDTRTLKGGDLYIALKGNNFDGHAFVEEAFRKQAAGAVVGPQWKPREAGLSRPLLRVADPAAALRDIAAAYRRKIAPRIVAVSGSVGKSTVKQMTAAILATTMPTACTKGNWNNEIGLPLSLLAMEPGTRAGVFEAGMSHPGELAALCGILRPDWGILTNVGPVHIEFFDTLEAIAKEKAELIRSLPREGIAFLNRDAQFFDFFKSLAAGRVVTVSMRAEADYVCVERNPSRGEATLLETAGGERFKLKMPLKGDHNIANAMLAVAAGRAFGVPWERIGPALAGFSALPMRWEEKKVGGVTLINDAYNANPMSMMAAVTAFGQESIDGGKWLILGGMLELGVRQDEEHLALGRAVGAGEWAGLVVVGQLGGLIAQGADEAGFPPEKLFRCNTNATAAQVAGERLKAGDAVLLKASRGIRLEEVERLIETQRGGA